jgi:hypothetical protein
MEKRTSWFFAGVLALLFAMTAWAEKVATVVTGRLARMEYAMLLNEYGAPVGEATFDYFVEDVVHDYAGTVGYLNVLAELGGFSSPTGGQTEWIVRNVPMLVSEDMTGPPHSVWFNPGVFGDQVWPGQLYATYAMISDEPLDQAPSGTALDTWDFSLLPGGYAIWWLYDTLDGNLGQLDNAVPGPPSTAQAKTEGPSASPYRTSMPDIAQKPMECGPTSTANSFRWLAKEHGFEDKLPKKDDDLIKDLMTAMTGEAKRPFKGLDGDQLHDGKITYANDKKLPLIVKGGLNDPNAGGAKAFDFIQSEIDAGEDVEFLIGWPGGTGSHWVTVTGYGVRDNHLFLRVNDPDDGKTGSVTWELNRQGDFITPRGRMLWAVSESFVKQDEIALPADTAGRHHTFSGHVEVGTDGSETFVSDASSNPGHSYDSSTHVVHLVNEQGGDVKVVQLTATFFVPLQNYPQSPRFNPNTDPWAPIKTSSQIVQRNQSYQYSGAAAQFLEIEQRWKLVPNPSSEDIDVSPFFRGAIPLQLRSFTVHTWCLNAEVKVEELDSSANLQDPEGVTSRTLEFSLARSPTPGCEVRIDLAPAGVRLTAEPQSILFTPTDWEIPRTVVVRAAPDPNLALQPCPPIDTEILQLSLSSCSPIFQDSYLPPQVFPLDSNGFVPNVLCPFGGTPCEIQIDPNGPFVVCP